MPHRRTHLLWCGALACLWAARAQSVSLPPGGVSPRVFSPNGDGINDTVEFRLDNPALVRLSGRVLDPGGAEVADLTLRDLDTLVWDGRDRTGAPARPGPYLYVISAEGRLFSGWVVVVR